MKKFCTYLLSFVLVILCLVCCGNRKGRVIPEKKMSMIYADIFLADQWLKDHSSARTQSDTTFFYGAVLDRYGYTRQDFLTSVNHYVDKPERFSRILHRTSEILSKRTTEFERLAELQRLADIANAKYRKYERHSFSSDSLSWTESLTLWNFGVDTLACDTVVVKDTLANVERKDSLWAD